MGNQALYREIAQTVNQTLGRQAITATLIKQTIAEAKKVRQIRGSWGLIRFLENRAERLLSPHEVEKLKQHPRWKELTTRMLEHLAAQRVITPTEALMLKRMVS
ncbi:hypothetical protein [Desmospora profundinema]|uniref:3-methyladenine DNA glycosylase Tag n=1 Tax=Desmospora profundinema TaxID=1571184 RepID=A0ABU1IR45_9BACL|nr:hypothetical protein [Desmospora profundinema]MDR6227255.1 3-methyladenine DNA glycosylase Tag [Desmospora profundinema]